MALITISLQQPKAIPDRTYARGDHLIRIEDGDLWIQFGRYNGEAVAAARALAASLTAAADAVEMQLQIAAEAGVR